MSFGDIPDFQESTTEVTDNRVDLAAERQQAIDKIINETQADLSNLKTEVDANQEYAEPQLETTDIMVQLTEQDIKDVREALLPSNTIVGEAVMFVTGQTELTDTQRLALAPAEGLTTMLNLGRDAINYVLSDTPESKQETGSTTEALIENGDIVSAIVMDIIENHMSPWEKAAVLTEIGIGTIGTGGAGLASKLGKFPKLVKIVEKVQKIQGSLGKLGEAAISTGIKASKPIAEVASKTDQAVQTAKAEQVQPGSAEA